MASLAKSLVVLLLGALPFAHSQTTQAPATTATDGTDPRFMGFYLAPDSTQALTITAPAVWATRGSYAGQCDNVNSLDTCSIPTACLNSRLTFDNGDVHTCDDGFDCATFTIYQTSPFGGPSATNFNCRVAWVAHTVYRQLVETMKDTSTPPTSTSTSGTLPSNTNPPPDDNDSGSSNLGPALGGGIGGAVALIGLGGLGVFLYRRKKKQEAAAQGDKEQYNAGAGGYPNSAHHMSSDGASIQPGSAYPNTPGGWSSVPSQAPYTPYGGYNSMDGKQYYGSGVPFAQNGQFQNQSPPSELGTNGPSYAAASDPRFNGARQVPGLPAELPGSGMAVEAPSPQPGLDGAGTMISRDSRMDSMQSPTAPDMRIRGSMSSSPGTNDIRPLNLGSPGSRA